MSSSTQKAFTTGTGNWIQTAAEGHLLPNPLLQLLSLELIVLQIRPTVLSVGVLEWRVMVEGQTLGMGECHYKPNQDVNLSHPENPNLRQPIRSYDHASTTHTNAMSVVQRCGLDSSQSTGRCREDPTDCEFAIPAKDTLALLVKHLLDGACITHTKSTVR